MRRSNRDIPSQVEYLPAASGCRFPAAAPGDRVALLITDNLTVRAPFFSIDQLDVIERAEDFVAQWRRRGSDPGTSTKLMDDVVYIADVVVTESAAPVYLVLGGPNKVVWNIHTAPGAKISGVALIGGEQAGVANLAPEVPVRVMSESDAERCRATPFLQPTSEWDISKRARTEQMSRDIVAKRNSYYATFDRWFRTQFNRPSSSVAIGGERVDHFLVGPAPESPDARLPYRPLAGSLLKIMPGSAQLVFGGKSQYRAKHDEIVRARAKMLVGGELALLDRR